MILPFEFENKPPHLIGDTQEIKDMNLINDEIFNILDIQYKSRDSAYDIFTQIQETLMQHSSIVYDLPFNDSVYNKPIQQISVICNTIMGEYKLSFPITCFNFHSKKSLEKIINGKEEFNIRLIKHEEIKENDVYYLPLMMCAANKNIKCTFPQTLKKEIEDFFFRRKLGGITFTDGLYDWRKVKELMSNESNELTTVIYYSSWKNLNRMYKDNIEYFIEELRVSSSLHTIDKILNCPLYKLIFLMKGILTNESRELYYKLAKNIEMKLDYSKFENIIENIIPFIYYLIGYARVKALNNDTVDSFPWGGKMGIDWYSIYYI